MTAAASAASAKRLFRPLRSWTLRRRLVVAVVALVAVLGIVIGSASVLFLNDYLINRLDHQLGRSLGVGVRASEGGGGGPGQGGGGAVGVLGQQQGTFGAVVQNGKVLGAVFLGEAGTQAVNVKLPQKIADVPANGTPETVDLGGELGSYRLAAATLADGDVLVIGLPLTEVNGTISQLVFVIVVVTFVAVVIAIGVGLLIIRLALRPLVRVAATATQVSELPLAHGEVALKVRVPEDDTNPRTEVGRVGSALNKMLGHVSSALTARQASENKVRQFVADASHELRTPLASIRGYAELTRRSPEGLPPDAVHSIGRIESEAQRMTVLVEDLLLLARLDEGRELDAEPVDLSLLLIDAVSDAHAAGRDHTWALDVPGEPVIVTGDEPRLHQVIANLLTNARVHTPPGTAVSADLAIVHPTKEKDAAGRPTGPTAVLTIADDGPGIPESLQPILFERFARGDSSRSRATGSTGLGLAIVRAVVESQGGTISVTSEPGATAFRLELPVAAAPTA